MLHFDKQNKQNYVCLSYNIERNVARKQTCDMLVFEKKRFYNKGQR